MTKCALCGDNVYCVCACNICIKCIQIFGHEGAQDEIKRRKKEKKK